MATPSLRAVTYLRKSTDRQEASIPEQREAVLKLAKKLGYVIVREYVDEGISGDDTERRTGFLQMLDDARRLKDFDCVLCWNQARFGRFDPLEAGYWIKPLRDRGIFLETVAEGRIDWNDFAGRIVYAVQQEGKNAFLKDLSKDVMRGLLAKAKRGEWVSGRVPYAYRKNADKKLEPDDPAHVEVVRWLFREYLRRDVSLCTLASELNARGVPSPNRVRNKCWTGRGLWSTTGVRNILIRPAYVGDFVWNSRHMGAYHTIIDGEIKPTNKQRHQVRVNAAKDRIIFPDRHEALVDRATFERVQEKLVARREYTSSPPAGGPFLFAGLAKCGDCGYLLYGMNTWDNGQLGGRKYVCGQYHAYRKAGCNSNKIEEPDLVEAVLGVIESHFLKPENLAKLRDEIRRQEKAERAGAEPKSAALDRRIAELKQKIDTGTERWLTAPDTIMAAAGAKIEQWRRELEQAEEDRRVVAKPAVSEAALEEAVELITKGVAMLREQAHTTPADELRPVLQAFVDKIVVQFEQRPYGQKTRGVPIGGTLHLKDALIVSPGVHITSASIIPGWMRSNSGRVNDPFTAWSQRYTQTSTGNSTSVARR
jgi:DNA invertase Pin-like site-specific DNA recombinase